VSLASKKENTRDFVDSSKDNDKDKRNFTTTQNVFVLVFTVVINYKKIII